ncbi:HPr kinase/phosphorylase [Rhizobium sp. ARZ01]|uniref:HPr kinase/phosphorylase n=1 Tax=Rhizobium sp. ARZ01 TaxID=2769313 RepID=UPI00178006D0|nr:HPr kinase/phosphorylase [Rhizobium sp. ARZ01]MBD9374443.1 HPr kinase/phosphorylase [Rhizobium sp. ARZ01]
MSHDVNVHGTAIVIGTTGLIFMGPSGSGKTAAALHCMGRARERGLFSALVADDQVLLRVAGAAIVARAPAAIAGLAEVRGSGIVSVETVPCAILARVIRPIPPPFAERIAPEAEDCEILPGQRLPVTRLPIGDGFDFFDRLTLILPFLVWK